MTFAVMGLAATAMAESSGGDFEITGHVNTGLGYQHQDKNAGVATGSIRWNPGILSGEFIPDRNAGLGGASPMVALPAGAEVNADTGSTNTFEFFVDEIELDIAKSFGENIRLRADLDFGNMGIGSNTNNGAWGTPSFNVEQGYVTLNIPVGNGMEFLLGRFNAPIGFEAVDRNDNDTFSHSSIYQYGIRPKNLTGMKFYYAFSDLIDWHIYIVNNLRDAIDADRSNVPSVGTRLGFTWGEEGKQSTIGISGAAGPDIRDSSKWGDWSYIGDVDFNFWATDSFAIGGEGIFRMDASPKGSLNGKYLGGILNLHYVFNDVWDGTLKYAYLLDKRGGINYGTNGVSTIGGHKTGDQNQIHQIGLAGQYHITDGAKMQLEYRLDWTFPSAGRSKSITQGGVMSFAYEF